MPYDHNHLKSHIISYHPQMLDSFEKGWDKLGQESQSLWIQEGIINPGTFYDVGTIGSTVWQSWARVRYEQCKSVDTVNFEPEDLRQTLALLIRENMPHTGALYDMPEIPGEGTEDSEVDEDNLDLEQFEARDGYPQTAYLIAEHAAEAIFNAQLPKIIEMVRSDIKENGLQALRKWYPAV